MLLRELQPVAHRCKHMSRLLGSPPFSNLNAMISCWLRKQHDMVKPTWKKLVEVLAHPDGGRDPFLAMEIAESHGKLYYKFEVCVNTISLFPVIGLQV